MIRAIGWTYKNATGVLPTTGAGATAEFLLPDLKNFGRMPTETRASITAATLAQGAAEWNLSRSTEIGCLAASPDSSLRANRDYFFDYITAGRSLGRGNLFIYTLPTSTLGEIAIALNSSAPRCTSTPIKRLSPP